MDRYWYSDDLHFFSSYFLVYAVLSYRVRLHLIFDRDDFVVSPSHSLTEEFSRISLGSRIRTTQAGTGTSIT